MCVSAARLATSRESQSWMAARGAPRVLPKSTWHRHHGYHSAPYEGPQAEEFALHSLSSLKI